MHPLRILAALAAAAILILPSVAPALGATPDEAKSFAVMPFAVNGPDKYQYLSQGIQSMLVSRLNWPGHMEHMDKDAMTGKAAPGSLAEAEALRGELGADYLVWGDATILGEQASLDVHVDGANGASFTKAVQSDLSGLIPALQGVAAQINAEIFQRPEQTPPAQQPINRMNPDLVFNETNAAQQYYLNPQFQFTGGTETPGRWKSPALRFAANGMTAGDLDGDGVNELVFITDTKVLVYAYQEARLVLQDEMQPSTRIRMLNVNILDLNKDGFAEIIISAEVEGEPWGMILTFRNHKLQVDQNMLRFYMNVLRMPPDYRPVLLGQKKGNIEIFDHSVYEVAFMSGGYTLGKKVALPEDTNVFNFAFLPQPAGEYKIIVVNKEDRILTYTSRFERVAMTEDRYAGSSLGFEYPSTLPGLQGNPTGYMNSYYIPLRLLTNNLDQQGGYELLVNKNVSMAAVFFPRYRSFPQGELQNLFWDGVGMSLAWKTRRIKGTVVDYGLADVNNDGKDELYVCVVTYPGALGVAERKTMLLTYNLDLSSPKPTGGPQAGE